ncbi:KTSC domain-containing protein [Streptomyces sp. NBC_00876]|uniref:KTSC domain-containing protein n=1 Tax=Streptomyces sp. NBC_00876 TaxID=2975853 RepID=UPI00386B3BC5|nr:KTSC domain-containing protein [Streptomyces sp. NBC_00876]
MLRTPVVSSNLDSVGYDRQISMLEVQFRNGRIYQYAGVPESVYSGLVNAFSKGAYLDTFVKKAGYPATKVA